MTRRDSIQLLAGGAAIAAAPALAADDAIAKFYARALVIDALSFGHKWDEAEYAAVKASGYSGIVESLERQDLKTAIEQLLLWKTRAAENADKILIALAAKDFERAKREKKLAVLMNFQNATMLDGDVDNVDALHALGMRSFQLTYNSRNLLGDGCTERTNAGLSDFGVEVVERMNKIGVLVDLSHCGRQTTLDGIEVSKKPVAITHTMVEKFRPGHPRAKTDDQMKACADKGGVVGIAALGYFIGPDPGGATTIETYADHIEHAVNLAGREHVGLSTDFPVRGLASWATKEEWYEPRLKSFKPSYDVKWPPYIPDLDGPDRFLKLARILSGRGWKPSELEALLGKNWLRLFKDVFGG
ncbi:MAG: membrane dipeptidase [Parvularculaceae bacterium]